MKEVTIGLIGFGTVGSGVYNIIKNNGDLIQQRTGLQLKIKTICDLRTDIVAKAVKGITVTDNWKEVINDKHIDFVIELIGGIEPAKKIVLEALKKGKSVISANKKLLAEEGKDLFKATTQYAQIGFEAAVAGGIPCILSLQEGLVANKVKTIMGILNGTTNYILTQMENTQQPFPEALKDAQEQGFAEADPTFDIEGQDAGHKISLLSMLAFGKNIDFKKIPIEGITKINNIDIAYARDMGYTIKLLGIAKNINNKIDIRVHPTMIPNSHPLATVREENNAVMFDCDMTDPILLYGKGAGSFPTASAVLSDVIRISTHKNSEQPTVWSEEEADYLLPAERVSRYYIRVHTIDEPGILSEISGILGKHSISIASVMQKEWDSKENYVPLILMTHEAPEMAILKAVEEINNFEFTEKDTVIIRVEDSTEQD